MLRSQLILSHLLSLVIWLNLYRNYNVQLASVAPPFYYDGATMWLNSNHTVRNITNCNGLWSCAKTACELHQIPNRGYLSLMPFGDYDNNSCSIWGTLASVPAYRPLLQYGVFNILAADLLCLIVSGFFTIFIWSLFPLSYISNGELIELKPRTKCTRAIMILYCIVFSLIKILSLIAILCTIIFTVKFQRISGDMISKNINDIDISVNVGLMFIIITESIWTISKFVIVVLIHGY